MFYCAWGKKKYVGTKPVFSIWKILLIITHVKFEDFSTAERNIFTNVHITHVYFNRYDAKTEFPPFPCTCNTCIFLLGMMQKENLSDYLYLCNTNVWQHYE